MTPPNNIVPYGEKKYSINERFPDGVILYKMYKGDSIVTCVTFEDQIF